MKERKDHDVLAHFNERATSWDQLYERPQFKDRLSLFVNGIRENVVPQASVLDYGCGTGRIAIELAACGYQVHGVDGSSEMIEKARLEAKNRELSHITFEPIDPTVWQPGKPYDAIICSSVLEYVPDDESLLVCFAKALVPGGTLLISIPYAYSLTGIMEDLLKKNRNRDVLFARRRYGCSSFTRTLERIGFDAPKWTSFELPLFGRIGVRLSRIPFLGVMMLANVRRLEK